MCPWNIKFAKLLRDESPFAPREALGGKDARSLARDVLGMTQAEFSRAFKGSPMKRAKLRGVKRNAAARAFAAQLPLTLDMSELNGNEKHADLPKALPANASRPGTIRNGDLMLYGADTLVSST